MLAFLATASLGAIWSSCSPDFGLEAVLDRFAQIEPTVLFAVDGYTYGGKPQDRRQAVREIRRGLPTLEATVLVPYLDEGSAAGGPEGMTDWNELLTDGSELAFDMPKITRDMIVVIQGFVVLFAGALEAVFKRPLAQLIVRRSA